LSILDARSLSPVFYAQRGGEAARRLPAQNAGRGFRIAFGQPSPPALRGVPGVTPLASRRPRAAPPCLEHLHSRQENEAHGPGSEPSWAGERSGTPQPKRGLPVRLRALRGVRASSPAEAQSACASSSCVACRSSQLGVARWLLEGGAALTGAAAQAALHFTESWGVEQRDAADEARASPAGGAVLAADPGVMRTHRARGSVDEGTTRMSCCNGIHLLGGVLWKPR